MAFIKTGMCATLKTVIFRLAASAKKSCKTELLVTTSVRKLFFFACVHTSINSFFFSQTYVPAPYMLYKILLKVVVSMYPFIGFTVFYGPKKTAPNQSALS